MENPYQAPIAEALHESGSLGLRPLAVLAKASLLLYGISVSLQLGLHVLGMIMLARMRASQFFQLHDTYVHPPSALGLTIAHTSWISAVLFLMWKYRAAKNARVLNPSAMTYTPAMAVASYFLPLVNLVIPYRAMSGIARAAGVSQRLVVWWWAGHLAHAAAFMTCVYLATTPQSDWGEHLAMATRVIALVVSWRLLMAVTRAQEDARPGEEPLK